ncbi:glycosyltransferase [Candidatus Microgenomates bacterium]|nr:glycosyltransferase [Candidatus Microgenomates bacterium]
MKKIAVITSVYNGEQFITECIKSVESAVTGQDFSVEHTVIDNGSTDGTTAILARHTSARFKKLKADKTLSVSAARNKAIGNTDADYIFCLDADDILLQNALATLFAAMLKHQSEWVYGDFLRVDERLSYLTNQDYYGYQFETARDMLTSIFKGEHFFQQNSMYSKKLFNLVGGFDEHMDVCEDLDMVIRFLLKGYNAVYVPSALYLHRFHADNVSKTSGKENNMKAHQKDIEALRIKYHQQ